MSPPHPVLAVTTPTGHVGSRVVRLLLAAGVRPRLLLRDPARLPPDIAAQVDAVAVDQDDRDAVVAATAGVDALFWVDPPTGDPDPAAGYARIGAHAAAAVREHGIGHTVFLSSVGAEKRHGVGEIDGLGSTEEALDDAARDTGTAVLHLRGGYFFTNLADFELENLRAGVLPTLMPLDAPMPWIDPRDIGDVAAARLLARAWSGRAVQAVHGPEDLSFARVAAIVSEALGRPVRAERVDDDEMRRRLRGYGLGECQVEGVVGMSIGLREDFTAADARSLVTTTPTALAGWASAHLRPRLAVPTGDRS